jgi:phosphatidylinositol glycan class K
MLLRVIVYLFALVDAKSGNTQVIILSTSRFWNNYRHSSNALAFHHILRKHRIPESDILLFLAHDYSCDCRNTEAGSQFYDVQRSANLAGRDFPEIDYVADSANPTTFSRAIAGEYPPFLPRSLRLKSNAEKLLVFHTGHSGVGFMNFHNMRQLPADVLNVNFVRMANKQRFNRTLFFTDTCRGAALHTAVEIDNFSALSSSAYYESSYAYQADSNIGALTADRFSHHTTRFLMSKLGQSPTLGELQQTLTHERLSSTATLRDPMDAFVDLEEFLIGDEGRPSPVNWQPLVWKDSKTVAGPKLYNKRLTVYERYMRPISESPTNPYEPSIFRAIIFLGILVAVVWLA